MKKKKSTFILGTFLCTLCAVRVFIGIKLSSTLKEKIIRWQDEYQKEFKSMDIRWTKKKNLHITLIPPWEEKDVEKIITKLKENPVGISSFHLAFGQILFFPQEKPTYIWVVGKTPKELLKVRKNLSVILNKPMEKRPLRLHSTIARISKDASVVSLIEKIDWQMHVTSFTLFASKLSPKGAEYTMLSTYPLS